MGSCGSQEAMLLKKKKKKKFSNSTLFVVHTLYEIQQFVTSKYIFKLTNFYKG